MNKKRLSWIFLAWLIVACNLPSQQTQIPAQKGTVQIISPHFGATISGSQVAVQFTASGGPFIEANLFVDNMKVGTVVLDGTSENINSAIMWQATSNGEHIIMIELYTDKKEALSSTILVTINDIGNNVDFTETLLPQPSQTIEEETARQRIIQILSEEYGIAVTNPPVARKKRPGVTTDPWTSAVYYQDLFISISLFPDGNEVHYARPLNKSQIATEFLGDKPTEKPNPICRPSGTLKLLAVFVDYQTLDVNQAETSLALNESIAQINGRFLEASQAVGLQSPILEIQATSTFLSSPPTLINHLLTPDLIHASTGIDPSQFDLLVQVDLDGNDSSGMVSNSGSYGFATSGCGDLPLDVNIWIAISKKDQLFQSSNDPRLQSTLGHEILHTMGYPIGITGLHEWACGDGSTIDSTDQCDQNYLPTLMMGWTDTDGDGIVEILDTTPYGLYTP